MRGVLSVRPCARNTAEDAVTSDGGSVVAAHPATTSYAYDALNRVTQVTEAKGTSDQRAMTYAYDKVGNQTSLTDWRGASRPSRSSSFRRGPPRPSSGSIRQRVN